MPFKGNLTYMCGQPQADGCCIRYECGVKVISPDCNGSARFSAAGLAIHKRVKNFTEL